MEADRDVALAYVLGLATALALFVVGRVLTRTVDAGIDRLLVKYKRAWYRLRARFVSPPAQRVMPADVFTFGHIRVRFCLISQEIYDSTTIQCHYRPGLYQMPNDLLRLREQRAADYEERHRLGERVPHNSAKYKLLEFDQSYRMMSEGSERPVLILQFTDTDYYSQQVTNNDTAGSIRNRYMRPGDLAKRPIREFASVFGVTLTLITKDQYLILSRRSEHTSVAPGLMSSSVSEGALRPADANPDGSPDPFRTAVRGAYEELRIRLEERDIEFLGFGADSETGIYNLIGCSNLKYSRSEIEEAWLREPPTDRWEQDIYFVPFEKVNFAEFCATNPYWSPVGLVSVVLTFARSGQSRADLERALITAASPRGVGQVRFSSHPLFR